MQEGMDTARVNDPLVMAFAHHRAGRLKEAEAAYRAVLSRRPGHPAALHGLGLIDHQVGRHEEAVSLLRQAVQAVAQGPQAEQLRPQQAEFRCNLAAVLGRLGRHREAAEELQGALRIRPDFAPGWCNLGVALERTNKPNEAATAYQRAIELKPNYAQAHHSLGNALRRLGRLSESEAAHRRAIELRPDHAGAWGSLAATLSGQGRLEEVIACRRKVVALRQKSPSAGSALLATLHYDATITRFDLLEEARRWATIHAEPLTAKAAPHDNDRDPDRRLRIGFVSSNFSAHPEGRFIRPVLANLDRERFETYCYSNTARPDGITATLRHLCDQWREIRTLPETQAERLIRQDRIDVLLDLTGHFGNNRLLLFARRPAPVQAIHFGYPGTSGMSAMDWRISDALADPPRDGEQATGPAACDYTSERLMRLPHLAWCYEPPVEARAVAPLPGDRNGHITFCCVNNTIKVNDAAIAAWAQILRQVPGSRLQILAERSRRAGRKEGASGGGDPDAPHAAEGSTKPGKQNDAAAAALEDAEERSASLAGAFERHGVETGRVVVVPRQSRGRYFEWITSSADIALDPFPYNGGVTTCDTLWMGVPLISLEANTYWSRQGLALLTLVGLPELCATSAEAYVTTAVALANDRDRLRNLRRGLRERLAQSPITDAPAYAAAFGEGLRTMWREWCR